MKKSIIVLLISFIFLSCTKKNNVTEIVENQKTQETVVLEEVQDEIKEPVEPVHVMQFTEEDRYFSLDGRYNCTVSSGLARIDILNDTLTYIHNEEKPDTEQKISFINKNGIDYIQLSKKFPKELTTDYIYGDSKDIETDDKILFLAGKRENSKNVFFPYTKGFSEFQTFFWVRGDFENYICTFKDCSSSFVEEGKDYSIDNLHKLDLETPWVEGVPGDGIGEGFTISFWNQEVLPTLVLMNGYISFDKPYLYEQNNRIKKIKVKGLTSGKEKILDVIDTPHPQTVDISFITDKEDIRVEIAEVYKGTKYDDTCLQYCNAYLETIIPYKSGKAD